MAAQSRATPFDPQSAPQLAGLVQACKDEPEDDNLRLILADWLDDHGEPERAELIRLSLRLSRPRIHPACQAVDLAQLARLRKQHDARWLGNLPLRGEVQYHRGFIEVVGSMDEMRKQRAESDLAAVAPWTERMRLMFSQRSLATEYLNNPCARAFTSLDLSNGNVDRGIIRQMIDSPWMPHLRELRLLLRPTAASWGWLLFAASSGLTGLRSLGIQGKLTLKEVRSLAGAPFVTTLRSLTLRMHLDLPTLRVLAGMPELAGLTHLDLTWCQIPEGALAILAGSPHLRQLHTLRLGATGITDVAPLATSPLLDSVRVLELPRQDLTATEIEALARSSHLGCLEELNFTATPIGNNAIAALVANPAVANLRRLNLTGGGVSPDAIRALAASPHLGRLESLNLGGNNVLNSSNLGPLFKSERLTSLRHLNLSQTNIDDRGIDALVAGPLAPGLRSLQLSWTPIGPASANTLARSRSLQELEALELAHCHLGPDGFRALAGSTTLECLTWLSLAPGWQTAPVVGAFANPAGLPALVFLHLEGLQNVPRQEQEALVRSPRRDDVFFAWMASNVDSPPEFPAMRPSFPGIELL
jgi:uncharacterized protein (TIGR02996 family)